MELCLGYGTFPGGVVCHALYPGHSSHPLPCGTGAVDTAEKPRSTGVFRNLNTPTADLNTLDRI